MPRKKQHKLKPRRSYDDDFKAEAVQMLLDGRSASRSLVVSGSQTIIWCTAGRGSTLPMLVRLVKCWPLVQELEAELRRVEREREVLKRLWTFSADKIG